MIFEPNPHPRVYFLPPGVDFGAELVRGLKARSGHLVPHEAARTTLFLGTRRMQRHLRDLWDAGPPALLPRLRLVTDIADDPDAGLPPAAAPIARRFELFRLVTALLDADPNLAPRAALWDLSDGLAGLLAEMETEGVAPGTLAALDGTDQSEHWQTALRFLSVIESFLEAEEPGPEARLRRRAIALAALWAETPPQTPMIVAGSTGSRGATAIFMEAVARLPQGALVLPGFDPELPVRVWQSMQDSAEDHPQFRFKRLLDRLELRPRDLTPWTDTEPASRARNRLISLSLRPAPVTDDWLLEGPGLGDLHAATAGLTLIEASSPRGEAEAIALGLRAAIAEGRTAALITPDRMLTRQVSAALDRWDIRPDDSAGQPLPLSPPGRFLRHVLDCLDARMTGADLLALIKHPLCHGGKDRGPHLRAARDLELHLRRHGPAYPDGAALRKWGDKGPHAAWAAWLAGVLDRRPAPGPRPFDTHLAAHLDLAEALSAGPGGAPTLWAEAAGREARALMDKLAEAGAAAGPMSPLDYATAFLGLLGGAEVRDPDRGHPQALIWGTLESRVQSADLIVLGGLNEGSWPEPPAPDPWLNRAMRREAGLTSPERRIGLSAHDYQQAVAGPEVWLSRAKRSDEAETVPSRWLNRLTNLLVGLPETNGPEALAAMRARGATWIAQAEALTRPSETVPAAHRPSPMPPVEARPREISVTEVQTLIRDPYAVYARRILRLNALDPLTAEPDAPLRGTILHTALETFIKTGPRPEDPGAFEALMGATETALEASCPWPAHRRLWAARMARVAERFLAGEVERRSLAEPEAFEATGTVEIPELDLTLKGKADRIDRLPDGRVILYDYKTGAPPTVPVQKNFDRQLLLEAAMTARGAFGRIGTAETAAAAYIGLGPDPKVVPAPLDDLPAEQVWSEFMELMLRWRDPDRGYSARARAFREDETGDYDHLARRGEWDGASPFRRERLR